MLGCSVLFGIFFSLLTFLTLNVVRQTKISLPGCAQFYRIGIFVHTEFFCDRVCCCCFVFQISRSCIILCYRILFRKFSGFSITRATLLGQPNWSL